MTHNTDEQQNTWRDNWFVKLFLVDIPFAGGFFRDKEPSKIIAHGIKYTFMLAGGSTLMMLGALKPDAASPKVAKVAASTASMALGMWAGSFTFQLLEVCASKLYQCGRSMCQQREDNEVDEETPLTPPKQPIL